MGKKPTYEELVDRIKELQREAFDRQFIEEEVQDSKGMLNAVLDSLPFDVFAFDSTNRYFLQHLIGSITLRGWTLISKKNWGDLIGKCPEDLPASKETLNLWTNNNRRALSGEIVADEVEYQSLEVQQDKKEGAKMSDTEMIYQQIIENSQDAIMFADRDGIIDLCA